MKKTHFLSAIVTSICLLTYPLVTVYAAEPSLEESSWDDDSWGDDNWEEEPSSPWLFSGFAELALGQFTQDNVVKENSQLEELRARLEFGYSHDLFEISGKGDFLFDQVLADTFWQTRELTIAFSPLENLDVKVGRQVLTWGTGDYLFLNDLFPKDWQSFFSGRDDEYLKAPSDSVRTILYLNDFTFDLVWTPSFTADNYLTGERFSFYSPFAGGNVAPAENFIVDEPDNDQWSARIATTKSGVEYTVYGYLGNWTIPVGTNSQGVANFPKMNAWGASARAALGDGLINAEFSYYNSYSDTNALPTNSPEKAVNDQFKFLIGYEQELVKNLTASVQYYLEQTQNYDALKAVSPFPDELVAENRHLLTLRLTHMALRQKLTSSFFTFYSPSDEDAYIKASVSYRFDDAWLFAGGTNLFFGKEQYSFFGQHQDNSNVWLRARYIF
jgi:hypothetical protein